MKGGTRKRGKTWSYYFDAAAVGGKRKKMEKGGFRTKKEAEAALANALSEYNRAGMVFEPSHISVSDYLDEWMNQYVKTNLSSNTLATYDILIRTHILPALGAYRLSALQSATIQALINRLKEQGYAKSTVTVILAILSGSLDYAVEPLQYIQTNPCRMVKLGKFAQTKRARPVVEPDAYAKMLALYPFGTYGHILLQLGWNCGLRIGECLGLSWDCIDFSAKTIRVENQVIQHATEAVRKAPKYHSIRTIQIGESLCMLLKAEKRRQAANEMLYGEYYTIYEKEPVIGKKEEIIQGVSKSHQSKERIPFVCVRDNGILVSKNNVQRMAKNIREEILPGFDYHSLRHSHATMLVYAGVNIKAVQQRLGHQDIATTLNTYAHCTEDMEKEAVETFEKYTQETVLPPN